GGGAGRRGAAGGGGGGGGRGARRGGGGLRLFGGGAPRRNRILSVAWARLFRRRGRRLRRAPTSAGLFRDPAADHVEDRRKDEPQRRHSHQAGEHGGAPHLPPLPPPPRRPHPAHAPA